MFIFINFARFHPLLVHLPVGVLIFAAMLEIWKRFRKTDEFNSSIQAALLFSFFAGTAAVVTGWFLSGEGGYDAKMLWQHKWSGVSLTVLAGVLFISSRSNVYFLQKAYTPLFVMVLGLLTFTGHLGGNLTHGAEYLFEKPEDASIIVTDIESAVIFSTFIEPVLKAKCNSCHNPSKAKGDLIMTSQEGLLAGGEGGSVFNFQEPEMSELLVRIHLPESEKKHMPPKGKKQLSADEEKLLKWWIENEACFDCTVDSSINRSSVASILEKYRMTTTNLNALNIDSVSESALEKLMISGIPVARLSAKNPLLIVNLSGRQNLNNSIFKLLKNIRENIVELNLSGSNFSDSQSGILKKMPHLKKLQLQNTLISDKAIADLKKLQYLESLNIYGTKVSDAAIADLKKISELKNLYCWQTNISNQFIEELQNAKPALQISSGIDKNIFGDAKLNSPEIFVNKELFRDSVAVFLKSDFQNAKTFYTLDGSIPDSSSFVFSDTFYLKKSTNISAVSELEGWGESPVVKKEVVRSEVGFSSAKLLNQPNDAYRADGSESLFDLKKGTENFAAGDWLGFRGEDMTTTMALQKKQLIEKVFVSSLSLPGSWIFFPKGIQVYTSLDGKNFKFQKETSYLPPGSDAVNETRIFEVNFEAVETQFLKIKILSRLKNPEWHSAPGEPCWLFIDEILAE